MIGPLYIKPVLLTSLYYSASVAMTFFSIKKSFVLVVLTYGVTSIFGNHMAYGPPVQTSMKVNMSHDM